MISIDRLGEPGDDVVLYVAGCSGCGTQAPAGDSWGDAAALWNCRSRVEYLALVRASHDRMWEPSVEVYEAARG